MKTAPNVETADETLTEETELKTAPEKQAYPRSMFDIRL